MADKGSSPVFSASSQSPLSNHSRSPVKNVDAKLSDDQILDMENFAEARRRLSRMRSFIVILCWLALANSGFSATSTNRDLSEFFDGREGCFVLYDAEADAWLRYNPEGCAERFSPCSTFKIANSLIALDTGIASGPEFSLKWDGVIHPVTSWNHDQTMRSTFSNSVVWFYQELARRIGPKRMSNYVHHLDYGNADTSGGITNFWLESTLKISADEQVVFLRHLWSDSLPSARTPSASRAG
jgi:beta-lactamase class D